MNKWWWLSFADEWGFRGLIIMDAPSFQAAVQKAWDMGINPGGEVVSAELTQEHLSRIAPHFLRKLLDKDVARNLGGEPLRA